MQSTNTVIYRDLDASQALTSVIDKKLRKLKRFSSQISSSRVVLDSPHQHKHKGKLFRAQIELGVKGNPITLHQDSTSIHVAVRDLFKAAERKLKEVSSKQQHKHVKLTDSPTVDSADLEHDAEFYGEEQEYNLH